MSVWECENQYLGEYHKKPHITKHLCILQKEKEVSVMPHFQDKHIVGLKFSLA